MAHFTVNIAQWHTYEIDAETLDEAIDNAIDEFHSDMRFPLANLDYDEMFVDDEYGNTIYTS